MNSFLTIRGLYNRNHWIFNDLSLPNGIDKDLVIGQLIYQTDELEVYIPDPVTFADNLKYFSRSMLPTWQRIYNALNLAYNPLNAYEETSIRTPDLKNQINGSSHQHGKDVTTQSATGYNSGDFENAQRMEFDPDSKTDNSSTHTETGTDTTVRRGRSQTGASVIESEIRAAQNNVINYIVKDLKNHYCLLVY